MTDGDRIRNLLGRYCDLVDAGDWAGVGALFARGRLVTEDGTVLAAGDAAVADFYARSVRLHDGSPRTKHLVVNTVLDEPLDDGSVVARSSYLVLQALEGGPLRPIITGRYVDRFAPGSDAPAVGGRAVGWHFVERAFTADLVGDLGEHLRYEL